MLFDFLLSITTLGIPVMDRCLPCICKQESECKAIGCKMDRGSLSCGFYQIKLPYYKDCGEPGKKAGESTEIAWKRCADEFECATTCVKKYFQRYKAKCPEKSYCEAMARLHNGGPNGCSKSSTDDYWNRIKRCLMPNFWLT
uniref:lysozyme n=1 Tax=Strongyloides venezuelensis TaxID=75913 RepID=A0A0K0EW39_STRVS